MILVAACAAVAGLAAALAESGAAQPQSWRDRASGPGILRFTMDYVAGSVDGAGQFMGGTEMMNIVAHDGMLFAGNGYWTDVPGSDPSPGAQILVKKGPAAPWDVEVSVAGALRVNAMMEVEFRTAFDGSPLGAPVRLLVADAALDQAARTGQVSVLVRDDSTGKWERTVIVEGAPNPFVRAFGQHRDRQTGVDLVFAGTGAGEIYRGAFDPAAPGRLRWVSEPEYRNPNFDGRSSFARVSAFGRANGAAFSSVAPRVVERSDGPSPSWREVYRWDDPMNTGGAGLRGLTGVPSPNGGHEVLVGGRERTGQILRIDPVNGYAVEVELEVRDFLEGVFGVKPIAGKLTAYNRFEAGCHPRTGDPIHWVGIAVVRPGDPDAAWLLIRGGDGRYETQRVHDGALQPHPQLVSTRTVAVAPWSVHELYVGGYDGAANNRRNHNTAWIFRSLLPDSGVSVEKNRR